jgi:HSP20 family protein
MIMSSSLFPSLLRKDQSPFFKSLQNEVDRVFDEFREVKNWTGGDQGLLASGKMVPKLDVSETENEIEITTELPGVKMEDMDISVTDNVLTIKAEKSAEKKTEEKDYHLVERSYGSYERSVPLGFSIEPKDVKAESNDGVLTIKITKPAEIAAKTQKIKVSKSG